VPSNNLFFSKSPQNYIKKEKFFMTKDKVSFNEETNLC